MLFDTFPCLDAVPAGSVALQCDSGCDDEDESSGKWEVFGGPTGPFRMDSRVCKAALIAGVIDGDGGKVNPGGSCIHNNNHANNASNDHNDASN
jgi:hypothetical protein